MISLRHLYVSCLLLIATNSSASQTNDILKALLNETGSEVASNVTLKFDPDGLETSLRAAVPDSQKVNAATFDTQLLSKYEQVSDPAQLERINRVVNSLVGQLHNKEPKFSIRVLKSDQVNAFTTGGPYIYIYSALLDQIADDDELAGILGHELAHVDAGHILRAQAQSAWIGLGSLAAGALTKGDDRKKVAEGHSAANATFSREHETEADILGALYAVRAGYKARGIATFFDEQMAGEEKRRAEIIAQVRAAHDKLETLKAIVDETDRRRRANIFYSGQYQAPLQNYNEFVPKYNTFLEWAKQSLATPSPWLIDHPFDKYRRGRVMALADYLEKKTERGGVTDPIILKVLGTVEKVEGKSI